MKKILLVGLCAAGLMNVYGEKPVNVRVRQTPGGPQLFVDGKAVAPRWVYPSHGAFLVTADTEWKRYEFPFDTPSPTATLSIRLAFNKILRGRERAQMEVRNFALTEAATGRACAVSGWSVIDNGSTGEATYETNGDLHVSLHPAKETHVYGSFHVRQIAERVSKGRYVLAFEAKSTSTQPIYPTVISIAGKDVRECPLRACDDFDSTIRMAAQAGVNFITPPVNDCWYEPGKPQNWAPLDNAMQHMIDLNPKALIVPRIGADAPWWMMRDHPELKMRNEIGEELTKSSVSCRFYRKAAVEHVEQVARHLREKFPRHFAGLHVCGQNTGEWFYYHSSSAHYLGYDVYTRDAFRAWLAERGEPDAATAEVPSGEDRAKSASGGFHSPFRERRVVLFNQFQQLEIVTFINELGAAIRRATEGESLAVFFYGYHWELAGTGAESGHLGVNWLIQNARENIDMLGAPISYGGRQKWPGFANVMSPAETLTRNGIMWIHEDDTRTYREPIWDFITCCGGPKINKEQTMRTMKRNLIQDALRGFGCWWMDLFGRGWFADPDLWQIQTAFRPVEEAMLTRKTPFTPDIAMIAHEKGMEIAAGWSRFGAGAALNRNAFSACGAPYGQYLLTDVLAKPIDAKLRVYATAYHLTEEQRTALIADRLAHPERTRVWVWVPGYISTNGHARRYTEEVTGFKLKTLKYMPHDTYPTPAGIAAGLKDASWPIKHDMDIGKLFTVCTNGTDEVWATYTNGEPALVVRRTPQGGADIFMGTFRWQGSEMVAAMAKVAGVRRYAEADEAAVWATEDYVMLQALKEGTLSVDTGTGTRQPIDFGLGDVRLYKGGREIFR